MMGSGTIGLLHDIIINLGPLEVSSHSEIPRFIMKSTETRRSPDKLLEPVETRRSQDKQLEPVET